MSGDEVHPCPELRPLVYISGALTDLPPDRRSGYLEFYENIGRVVATLGGDPYLPHQASDPVRAPNLSPAEVDDLDRKAVSSASIVIAYVGFPSLGVGHEIEMAHHMMKPVILLAEAERKVSRLTLGNPAVTHCLRFTDYDDAYRQLIHALTEEFKNLSRFPDLLRKHIQPAR
jgi:hypothetical protein